MEREYTPARARDLLKSGYAEVDLALVEFLARYTGTPVKWDLASFFALNPGVRDSAAGLATRVGRSEMVVRRELDDLALLGLLRRGQAAVYSLGNDPRVREGLGRFRAALERQASGERRRR